MFTSPFNILSTLGCCFLKFPFLKSDVLDFLGNSAYTQNTFESTMFSCLQSDHSTYILCLFTRYRRRRNKTAPYPLSQDKDKEREVKQSRGRNWWAARGKNPDCLLSCADAGTTSHRRSTRRCFSPQKGKDLHHSMKAASVCDQTGFSLEETLCSLCAIHIIHHYSTNHVSV